MKNPGRHYFAFLTLMAFMLQVFLPFFASYDIPSKNNDQQPISSLFGDKLLICTADGFKFVSSKDIESGNIPEQHKDIKCPLCYVASHGLKADKPVCSTSIAYIPATGNLSYRLTNEHFLLSQYIYRANSRSPPHYSFIS